MPVSACVVTNNNQTIPRNQECHAGVAGEPMYAAERERILGQRARRTERLAAAAARRSRNLAFAYSASLATAYAIIAADTLTRLEL